MSTDDRLERNKRNAVAFLTRAFVDGQPGEAADTYMGPTYTQHHPGVPDGRDAFVQFATAVVGQFPGMSFEFKRVIAEGDYVALHGHIKTGPGDRGSAIAEIFRMNEDGKIVEHWDVAQEIPEGEPVNSGML